MQGFFLARGAAVRVIDFTGVCPEKKETVVFSAFVADWLVRRKKPRKSWDTDESRIRSYLAPSPLWVVPLGDVTAAHVAGMMDALSASGLSASTVRRVYSLLSVIFRDACVRGFVSSTPCILGSEHLPRPSKMETGRRVMLKDTMRKLCAGSPIQRSVIYLAGLLTGARAGELCGLRWRDWLRGVRPLGVLNIRQQFHTGHGRIEKTTKTDMPKDIPVHPELARWLAAWRLRWPLVAGFQPFPDSPIFVTKIKKQHWRADTLRNSLRKDLDRLGLPVHTTHDLRHSFITHARAGGADRHDLRRITHPSPADVLGLYDHPDWVRRCAAVSALKFNALKIAI